MNYEIRRRVNRAVAGSAVCRLPRKKKKQVKMSYVKHIRIASELGFHVHIGFPIPRTVLTEEQYNEGMKIMNDYLK